MPAGLCKKNMSRLYKKPTVNPAFKRNQPLPLLNTALPGNSREQRNFSAAGLEKNIALAASGPRGNLMTSCKSFAFNNLF